MSLRPARDLSQYRGHVIETSPTVEPVTAAELRAFLRETEAGLPDAEALSYITEAREMIEENTGLALVTQSWRLALDRWPGRGPEPWWDGVRQGSVADLYGGDGDVYLPRYPLQDVDAITVYDEAGSPQSVTVASVFDVDRYRKPGRIGLKFGATWPVALRPTNGVEIVYTAGYGDAASDVPAALRRAVKQAAAHLYAHRGDDCCAVDAMASVASILAQYQAARL